MERSMLPTSDSEMGTGSYLLDLPPGLREMIFTFTLVSTNPVDILNVPKNKVAALTQTNQQLRVETIKIYYGQNTFKPSIDIDTIPTALKWFRGIDPTYVTQIQKIIISFSATMEHRKRLVDTDAALKQISVKEWWRQYHVNNLFWARAMDLATAVMAAGVVTERLEPEMSSTPATYAAHDSQPAIDFTTSINRQIPTSNKATLSNTKSRIATTSPLLLLPPELRNEIYTLSLSCSQPIVVAEYIRPERPSLLKVCRSISAEATQLYYACNTFNVYLAPTASQTVDGWLSSLSRESYWAIQAIVFQADEMVDEAGVASLRYRISVPKGPPAQVVREKWSRVSQATVRCGIRVETVTIRGWVPPESTSGSMVMANEWVEQFEKQMTEAWKAASGH
ncbi:hypothetical protein LTR17_008186 [Elasticomyces elasticus]|nr:hypothetical protein LTR17_008186 [Elasticomyces elasticus]